MGKRRSDIAARGMGEAGGMGGVTTGCVRFAACVGVIGALGVGVGGGLSGCAAPRSAEVSATAHDGMDAMTRPSNQAEASNPLSKGGASKMSGDGMGDSTGDKTGDGTSRTPHQEDLWARDQAIVMTAKAQIEVSAQALGLMTKPAQDPSAQPPEDPPTQAPSPITEDKTPTSPAPKPQPQVSPSPDAAQRVAALEHGESQRCDTHCTAADGICASQRTICQIASAHPLDASFEVECVWASQVCERAQARCRDCEVSL